MLPAVTVAVGNATALRINPRLPAEAVTVKGTPDRGRVPPPMSTVALPLKVALEPSICGARGGRCDGSRWDGRRPN